VSTLGQPLFSLLRDGFEEIRAFGELVVADANGVGFHTGELIGRYPARSLLKPFQFLACGIPRERWQLPQGEARYTACLGSVSGTSQQVAELQNWWKGSPLIEKLALPPSYPMDDAHRIALRAGGQPAQRVFHTCFSKHLAIVESCAVHGWSPQDYLSTAHPFHARLKATLAGFLGRNGFEFVTDGCLLPSPVLGLGEMAELYRRLAEGATPELQGIRELMLARPEWTGGPGRLDTRWMQANPGKVIAKEGADGLWGIGVLPNERYPRGLGIALKLASGFHPPLAAIAMSRVLEFWQLQSPHEIPRGQRAVFHFDPSGSTATPEIDISPVVGGDSAVFPGDVAFHRDVSADTGQGHHLTLSSIETTVHIGAHTDAPNHFAAGAPGIDRVPLGRYRGACQVVTVRKAPGTTILPADLAGIDLRAPRVLFKTLSFPNPRVFNADFVALSAELVESLGRAGVQLVGIDTPSIDPSQSKTLPAHHATARAGMGILEGIVLDAVEDGLYELVALPLRLAGADASPVRAVLRRLD
jgi:arylformamidase